MSIKFAAIPPEAIFDKRLEASHVRTLAALAYHGASKSNGCWPSYEKLAEELQTTRRSIIRHIKVLCDCGYLTKTPTKTSTGNQSSNIYRIDLDIVITSGIDSELVTHTSPTSDTQRHILVTQMSPKLDKRELDKENYIYKQKKPKLVTIQDWEKSNQRLTVSLMANWVEERKFCPVVIEQLISEFRTEMEGKGKLYADFKSAFQTYLNKGYLSKKPYDCLAVNNKNNSATNVYSRGGSL